MPRFRTPRHAAAGPRVLRTSPCRARCFHTGRVIHPPGVPVFRDDRGRPLESPCAAGSLTSPAPDAEVLRRRAPGLVPRTPAAPADRAERVLEAARGYRRLVPGAWGYGVFMNDPAEVTDAFRVLLSGGGRFAGHFEQIVSGVPDRDPDSAVPAAFARAFGGQLQP